MITAQKPPILEKFFVSLLLSVRVPLLNSYLTVLKSFCRLISKPKTAICLFPLLISLNIGNTS